MIALTVHTVSASTQFFVDDSDRDVYSLNCHEELNGLGYVLLLLYLSD